MITKEYPAFIFKQRSQSPIQVSFVATSADLDSWARVPTKRTGDIRNFQRAEIPNHIKEVKRWLNEWGDDLHDWWEKHKHEKGEAQD